MKLNSPLRPPTFIFIVSFWLFYGVHLQEDSSKIRRYADVVQFALSLIDALLFVHYLAIILIELRHLTPVYYVKVVRSPDGQSSSYSLGHLSIQRAAAQILEKYYIDFPVYNPYLEMVPGSRGKKGYKVYEVDGVGSGAINVSITMPTSGGKYPRLLLAGLCKACLWFLLDLINCRAASISDH